VRLRKVWLDHGSRWQSNRALGTSAEEELKVDPSACYFSRG
jgi:hypothetical protein